MNFYLFRGFSDDLALKSCTDMIRWMNYGTLKVVLQEKIIINVAETVSIVDFEVEKYNIFNSMNCVSRNVASTLGHCPDGVHTFSLKPLC